MKLINSPFLTIGVVIKNPEFKSKILLVQEAKNKYYEKSKNLWGLPSGKIAWTEKIKDGLKREMREELNIDVKIIGIIGIYQFIKHNFQGLALAVSAKILKNKKIKYDPKELKSIKWLTIKEALNTTIKLRPGSKEVLKDYAKKQFIPFNHVHFIK